jgi:hypothetical protein
MSRDGWMTALDVGSCLVVAVASIPMLGVMWLVPDEQTVSGHGVGLDRFLAALLFFSIAAGLTVLFSLAVVRREREEGSGLVFALWQAPCFKFFCFLDVPLLLLCAASVRVR